MYEKCIVITTIQHPTPQLKQLASLEGWRLIVVADKKTPLDWHLENCDFLSVEAQEKLAYNIIPLLPWNHYSRKNIGYLFAIERGASTIYDTDDDNTIIGNMITHLPVVSMITEYKTNSCYANPYEHFGKPLMWPRGYPLQAITQACTIKKSISQQYIPIQQGLVNNEPDLDALFRLTNPHHKIEFNHECPISLPRNVMAPFNSQNTIFHKDAFWALILPITTSFRVCDIWRGYWAQRILWDINAHLCFLPPTARQDRNNHSLIKDFEDEIDLYLKAEKLIDNLCAWQSKKTTLEETILELMDALIEKKFFQIKEYTFTAAWLHDLKMLGYTFPKVLCKQ